MGYPISTGTTVLLLSIVLGIFRVAWAVEPAEFEILTASGATRAQHHELRDMNAKQLSYVLELDYPNMAIGPSQYAQLKKIGWSECAGTRGQWDSFVDSVNPKTPYCVYEVGKYFIKENSLMLISLRYEGKPSGRGNCTSKPDNSKQYVVAIIYRHRDRESMQLDKLGLSCGK
jgi:hypothetical protein